MLGNLTENGLKLKRLFVEPKLPNALQPLTELANNLWWSWNHDATELFQRIDPERFAELKQSPNALIEELDIEKTNALLADKDFLDRLKRVHKEFKAYMDAANGKAAPQIAYFCMEYGLHRSLRLYSGGLGVLAGDYLKEVSDRNMNLIAVGLLYRYGYFQQSITLHGEQIHQLDPTAFTQMPMSPARNDNGEWIKIHVDLADRTVWAKVWVLHVGRVKVFLLDTDIDENSWEDRSITHQLYAGDNEDRLKQEILLGIGGVRALKALGLNPDLYHLNEGHAAFLSLERLRNYVEQKNLPFTEALEVVRYTQLFTTHTPVPAGHDAFREDLMKKYLDDFAHALDISWHDLMALGRVNPENPNELFSMSHLAIRTSQEVNGVSRLHGAVSQKMFNTLYPEFNPSELHIGYVTNGVHFNTWIAREWLDLYHSSFGKNFWAEQSNPKVWSKIHDVPAATIMDIRRTLKKRLFDFVRKSLQTDLTRRGENPRSIFQIINNLDENALVIGFARRFATYKRATLLFSNADRLAEIVNDPDRPVIFLFAGKAHPADKGGQEFIRKIYQYTQEDRFKGKVIFLENYNMDVAKFMVQGVDVWLNNPTRPKEASGTSGMKAVLNGVINFSVLDGWWSEGYVPGAGWALPEEETYADDNLQNELDAETIYNTLENEIIPTYFNLDENDISEGWVGYIKKNIAEIAPHFVMKRMLDDYRERYYNKLWERSHILKKDGFAPLRQLVEWKAKVRRVWDAIEVVEMNWPDTTNNSLPLGGHFQASFTLNLVDLHAEDIQAELVFFRRISETDLELVSAHAMAQTQANGKLVTYACDIQPQTSGVYEYGFRISPNHPLLPHRQDFPLLRWL